MYICNLEVYLEYLHNECWAIVMSPSWYMYHKWWDTLFSLPEFLQHEFWEPAVILSQCTYTECWVTCWRSPRTLKMSTGKWVWVSYSPCTMSAGYCHASIIAHAPRMLSYHCSLSHDCFWDTVISLPHYMHNQLCVTVMSQPQYINCETEIHMWVTHSTCSMSAELQP